MAVRCPACDRQDQWPRPEFGCSCGAVVRVCVNPTAGGEAAGGEAPDEQAPPLRPPFRPVAIRTAEDAVVAAERYVTWLGFAGVTRPGDPVGSGVDLRAAGLVARVDPTTVPTSLRAVECLWLHGLADSAVGAFFSLAGYEREARARADQLYLPLFVMDLTGTPQPLNGPADELVDHGPV
ncbi:hypothetical protein ACFP1Z_02980 [Streptomyces gamaensis]|uniref:Uncharacterized protein n=1 Tax=Streptomyces gamaensis TaxID=1763542 RepID=A0ABW0YWJ0_9ACTN